MSFVNLYANDLWSKADIDGRVQALIRGRFNQQDELKAARLARKADATEAEQTFVAKVDAWIATCIEEGRQAALDTALLAETLDYEVAQRRLAQYQLEEGKPEVTRPVLDEFGNPVLDDEGNPVVEVVEPAIPPITEFVLDEEGNPTDQPNPEWERVLVDRAERAEAQAVVDAAAPEVVALAEMRKSA